MLDYVELCRTTPCDENCAQVGSKDYLKRAKTEAKAYVNQLKRMLGPNPPGSFFQFVKCPHEFGTYLDLRFYFDDEDQLQVKYLMGVMSGFNKWDKEARKELEENAYEIIDKNKIRGKNAK